MGYGQHCAMNFGRAIAIKLVSVLLAGTAAAADWHIISAVKL